MDKQKQIEEIARTTCNYNAENFESCVECTKGWLLSCDRLVQAEKLYKAGYRKIPENAVVLTREEFESLGLVVETVQEYESQNGQPVLVKERKVVKKLQTDFTELLNQEIRELQLAQTRKETAEKFAERLKLKLKELELGGWVESETKCFNEVIDEICKEITEGNK